MTESSLAENFQKEVKETKKNSVMEVSFPKEMTAELAEICGIHAGDGYMRCRNNSQYELDISGNVDEKEYYDTHVVPLFERVFGIKVKPQFFQPRNTYGFRICTKEVCEYLHSFGFPYGKKTLTVEVPKVILESRNLDIIYGFLRGVFDTDGSVSFGKRKGSGYSEIHLKRHTAPIIALSVCSERLCAGVCQLLSQTGFRFASYVKEKKGTNNKKFILKLCGDESLLLWMYNIGFKNPVKMNRYSIWKSWGFCPSELSLEQQKKILAAELDPNQLYQEKLLGIENKFSKTISKRKALLELYCNRIPKD